jgi:hypothetical protein
MTIAPYAIGPESFDWKPGEPTLVIECILIGSSGRLASNGGSRSAWSLVDNHRERSVGQMGDCCTCMTVSALVSPATRSFGRRPSCAPSSPRPSSPPPVLVKGGSVQSADPDRCWRDEHALQAAVALHVPGGAPRRRAAPQRPRDGG